MNRSRNNRRDVDIYKPQQPGGAVQQAGSNRKSRRPLWYWPACVLIVLMITELVLIGAVFLRFGTAINYKKIPIISGPEDGFSLTLPDLDAEGDWGELDEEDGYNLEVGNTPIYKKNPIDPNVINILVLGLDSRVPGGNGRSDVNMIVSINRKTNTIKLVSLLRDTLVPIEGHDYNRLNSAYIYGGPGLSINTVNNVYNTDIQRFVKVDFFAIMDIVDAVGGVDIEMTSAEVNHMRGNGHDISRGEGVKHLDGEQALAYARIRKLDSDFGRTQRQRNVVDASLKSVRKIGLVKALDLMNQLLPQVTTNIGTNELVGLATDVIGMSGGTDQLTLPIKGSYTNKSYKGMSILAVDFEKNTQALHEFLYGQ